MRTGNLKRSRKVYTFPSFRQQLSDGLDLIVSQLAHWMRLATGNRLRMGICSVSRSAPAQLKRHGDVRRVNAFSQAEPQGVLLVFGWRHVLQIAQAIIRFVAVLMVDLQGGWPKKRGGYNAVQRGLPLFSVLRQSNVDVTSVDRGWPQHSSGRSAHSGFNTHDFAQARNIIVPFVSDNGTPDALREHDLKFDCNNGKISASHGANLLNRFNLRLDSFGVYAPFESLSILT